MNHTPDPLEDLLDKHYAGSGLTSLETDTLHAALQTDPQARETFVKRARLEQGLRAVFAPSHGEILKPQRRRAPRLWWAVAATTAAVGAVCLLIPQRAAPVSESVSKGQASEAFSGTVLPNNRSRISRTIPDEWTPRLRNFVLSEIDLRELSVSQAIDEVEAHVQDIGFYGDDVPAFDVYYEPPQDFSEPTVSFHRKSVYLLDVLRYLSALGGATEVMIGDHLRYTAPRWQRTAPVTTTLPASFFHVGAGPDFLESEDITEAERERLVPLEDRLEAWGITTFEIVDEASPSGSVTIRLKPHEREALSAARAIVRSDRTPLIAVAYRLYELPQALAEETFGIRGESVVPLDADVLAGMDERFQTHAEVSQVSYPRVLTRNGCEVAIQSLVSRPEWSEGLDELLETGVRIRCTPELLGEGMALDMHFTHSVIVGTRLVDGKEVPITSTRIYEMPISSPYPAEHGWVFGKGAEQDKALVLIQSVETTREGATSSVE